MSDFESRRFPFLKGPTPEARAPRMARGRCGGRLFNLFPRERSQQFLLSRLLGFLRIVHGAGGLSLCVDPAVQQACGALRVTRRRALPQGLPTWERRRS